MIDSFIGRKIPEDIIDMFNYPTHYNDQPYERIKL